jgi:hypothetical protein
VYEGCSCGLCMVILSCVWKMSAQDLAAMVVV